MRALGQLHLEGERGHRRAQLVRGVGEKAPLRAEGVFQPPEQRVDLVHERHQLARHIVGRQRSRRAASRSLTRREVSVQRLEAALESPGHDHAEHGNEQKHRHQHGERQLARERIARGDGLADLDRSFIGDVRRRAMDHRWFRRGMALVEGLRQIGGQRWQRGFEVDPSGVVVGTNRKAKPRRAMRTLRV